MCIHTIEVIGVDELEDWTFITATKSLVFCLGYVQLNLNNKLSKEWCFMSLSILVKSLAMGATLCCAYCLMLQVRIHKFLEKNNNKKRNKGKKKEAGESATEIKEDEKLRKKVIDLMKKQKIAAVRGIMKDQNDTKPWGPVMRTKVCTLYSIL